MTVPVMVSTGVSPVARLGTQKAPPYPAMRRHDHRSLELHHLPRRPSLRPLPRRPRKTHDHHRQI